MDARLCSPRVRRDWRAFSLPARGAGFSQALPPPAQTRLLGQAASYTKYHSGVSDRQLLTLFPFFVLEGNSSRRCLHLAKGLPWALEGRVCVGGGKGSGARARGSQALSAHSPRRAGERTRRLRVVVALTAKGRKEKDGGSPFRGGDRHLSEEAAVGERAEGRQDLGSRTEAAGSPAAETPEGLGLRLPCREVGSWAGCRAGTAAEQGRGKRWGSRVRLDSYTALFFPFLFSFSLFIHFFFGPKSDVYSKDLH